jgi:hypothetical protein
MSALITNIIPPDNFELVRDAIGAILLLELTNQKTLQNFAEEIVVYQERIKQIQADESLYINVLFDSATYSQYTPKDQQGLTVFFIDIYTTGKADPVNDTSGDMDSGTRLHRFMRMCRYILASNLYVTLGFAQGIIAGKYVTSFATAEPTHTDESNYSRMGRITFSVRIQESQALAIPATLGGADTMVKLQLTEHGYQYVFSQ